MKKTLSLFLFAQTIAFSINLYGQCANTANIFQFSYNSKNYEIVKELKTWTDAAACAIERVGYLVQIDDQNEQDSIYDAIVNGAGISPAYTSVSDGGGIAYIWIGATDKNTEGTWLWDGNNDNSGTNFWNGQGAAGVGGGTTVGGAYINWGGSPGTPNEPDDYFFNQDAAGIALANWPYGTAGKWNDINITNSLYFIIEYNTSSTGLNKPSHNEDIIIYPNPIDNKLNIITNNSRQKISTLNIYNQLGAVVYEKKVLKYSDLSVDLTGVKPGIYIINIEFQDGTSAFKKVVIK